MTFGDKTHAEGGDLLTELVMMNKLLFLNAHIMRRLSGAYRREPAPDRKPRQAAPAAKVGAS